VEKTFHFLPFHLHIPAQQADQAALSEA